MNGTARAIAVSASAAAAMLLVGSARADEAAMSAPSAGAIGGEAHIRPDCSDGKCTFRLSAPQLLALAEKLVREQKYEEARPLVAALKAAPGMSVPYNFLDGVIAMEEGDPHTAEMRFRAILDNEPGQTRVRLELARALLMQGKFDGADYHLRLAENDEGLPEDIARQIGNARSAIRSNRRFRFGFDFGFAPDSNINSATAAKSVDVNFGSSTFPLDLDEDSRARSGIGVTASVYAGVTVPVTENLSIVSDLDADTVNYEESDFDDYTVQLAAGPELSITGQTDVRLQAVGLYRWYGGRVATRQYGAKLAVQHEFDRTRRVAFQLDGRRTESGINAGYNGWQMGANATFEQVLGKAAIVSASVLARREMLDFDPYSSKTFGATVGIGAELPMGINAGLSGGVAHMKYDAPQLIFSTDSRDDWRFDGRAYAGLRKLRIIGFSPSVEYLFLKVDSNYELYQTERHRFQFKLARYF